MNKEKLKKQIGKCIKRSREATGYSQEMVAERLGLSTKTYASYEQGSIDPTVTRLAEIADIFECDLEQLVVDTSTRLDDQAKRVSRALEQVPPRDREMILLVIEQICNVAYNMRKKNKAARFRGAK
jgi:transcriptional regulator with XRE-family HTH domain